MKQEIIKFIKSYYNKTKKDEEGRDIVQDETFPMYTMKIEKNYYTGDKAEVIKRTIIDLENILTQLKEADKNNDRNMQSWESISK